MLQLNSPVVKLKNSQTVCYEWAWLIKRYLQEPPRRCIWSRVGPEFVSPRTRRIWLDLPSSNQQVASREQEENNAPGITQGFLHFAHPARVGGSCWDDLLPVKDDFWRVTPEFEIPALLWWGTHSHKAGVGQTPAFWPGLPWCGSGMQGGAAEDKLGSHFLFYGPWCPTQCFSVQQ